MGINLTIARTGLGSRLGWYGNGMHEAFKNPDQPSRWYSAFVSVCKAAEHELAENSWDDEVQEGEYPYLWFGTPLVVLDGQLFSADLDAKNELLLVEEKMCSVRFVYNTQKYRRKHYFVDVVTLEALSEYLEFAANRNDALTSALLKLAGYGGSRSPGALATEDGDTP